MNFNTTVVGLPFVRTNRIVIDYTAPNTATISISNQEFVKLADESYVPLGAEFSQSFEITSQDMATVVPLVSPETGELLGADMSYGQIMLGILAAIRANRVK